MNEQATMMNQQQQQQHMMSLSQNMMSLNQMNQLPQPQMVPMNRGYGMWPQGPPFPKPNPNPGAMKPPSSSSFKKPLGPRSNWKGKKVSNPNDKRRNEPQKPIMAGSSAAGQGNLSFNNYQPPTLNELQHQNRMKTRKFFPKKKFNNKNNTMNMNMNMIANNHNFNNSRSAPYAPRNTTSFIIRAKKSGGIASLVSPSPMTPAVLPTPIFSPSREVLVDMAKEEWGVDGYGSMKGLIRLRSSPGHEMEDEEDEGGSSESDVEEHVEVERRLDHDLSRFEMIYNPSSVHVGGMDYHNVLENRVDDQDSHIAHLEDENLILKERLFLMERELGDLRRRMLFLERRDNGVGGGVINEEVVENESENDSESREGHSVEYNNEFSGGGDSKEKDDGSCGFEKEVEKNEGMMAEADHKNDDKVCVVDSKEKDDGSCGFEKEVEKNEGMMAVADDKNDDKISDVEGKEENNKNDKVLGFKKKSENNDDVNDKMITVVEGKEGTKVENNDDMVAEHGKVTDVVEGNEENKQDASTDAIKAEENKCQDMEVNATDSNDIGSSKSSVGGDICMEDTAVLSRDVAN